MKYLKYILAAAAGAVGMAAYALWSRRDHQQIFLITQGDAEDLGAKLLNEKKQVPNGIYQGKDGSLCIAIDGDDLMNRGYEYSLFESYPFHPMPGAMGGIIGPFKSEEDMKRYMDNFFKNLGRDDDEDDDD